MILQDVLQSNRSYNPDRLLCCAPALSIHLAPVSCFDNADDELRIMYFVENAIISHPYPVGIIRPFQFFRTRGPGITFQQIDRRCYSFLNIPGQFPERTCSMGSELDKVVH